VTDRQGEVTHATPGASGGGKAAEAQVKLPTEMVLAGPVELSHVLALGRSSFGALVVSGIVTRDVTVGERTSRRLLGPGDFVREEPTQEGSVPVAHAITAVTPTRLAVMDDHLLVAVRRWPRLLTGLVEHLSRQTDNAVLQMTIAQQRKVEDRVRLLLAMIADRWGQAVPEGTKIDLRLTHTAIAQLVGARRPTVSMALGALVREGELIRDVDSRWVLTDAGLDKVRPPQPT